MGSPGDPGAPPPTPALQWPPSLSSSPGALAAGGQGLAYFAVLLEEGARTRHPELVAGRWMMTLSAEPSGPGPFLRASPSLDLLQPSGFCAPSLLRPLEGLKQKQSPAHLCPCPQWMPCCAGSALTPPAMRRPDPTALPLPSPPLLSLAGPSGPPSPLLFGSGPLPGAPRQPGGHRLVPRHPLYREDPSLWELSRETPILSLWTLHPMLSILQAPRFYFCYGASHMVLSVHHRAFLEGQAPSNVRGAGEAGREPTSSLERRRNLGLCLA